MADRTVAWYEIMYNYGLIYAWYNEIYIYRNLLVMKSLLAPIWLYSMNSIKCNDGYIVFFLDTISFM